MQRREFLRTATGTAAVVLPGWGFGQTKSAGGAKIAANDPAAISATRLAQLIREKKISSLDAVKACLKRIEEVNPRLNAVVLVAAERALMEARESDALLAKGTFKGPLHGVPMTIDDSLETAGVVSTGGTLGRKNYLPGRDAVVVARLRRAGAILLGKTNTSELAVGTQTNNLVYNRTVPPAGSSPRPRRQQRRRSGDRGSGRFAVRSRERLRRRFARPRALLRGRRAQTLPGSDPPHRSRDRLRRNLCRRIPDRSDRPPRRRFGPDLSGHRRF